MPRAVTIVIVLFIAGVVGYALVRPTDTDRSTPSRGEEPRSLKRAPDFALRDYHGNTVALAQFRGKPVLINSWAAWCPFCREELKDFAEVQQEFGERIAIVAIDRAEALEIAKRYTDALGVTGRLTLLLDPADSFYQSIGGFSMPETVFVDGGGNIVFHKRGPMKRDEIKEHIQRLFF